MTAPARTAAYHALHVVTTGRANLPIALQSSREHLSDERDRSLAAEIVTGTLRWLRSIDHLIGQMSRRTLATLDPEVVTVLRLSLYQILHLDRVPASAVVDDAVNLTRMARKTSASGFVNAVLRSTLRQRHRLPLPARPHDPGDRSAALAYLGITQSHPDWLIERWLTRYGFQRTERWVQFNNDTPSLMLRANRLRVTRDEARRALAADDVATEPARYAPDGLVVTSGNPLRRSPDGIAFVQDEASQLVSLVVGARPGELVLDLCASPGGKTTAIAADVNGGGKVVASDVRPRRLALLRDTVRLSGAANVALVRVPPSGSLPFAPRFDRVLVDAPCSGLGTVRRDPDIRWRRREEDLAELARGQVTLLTRASEVVRSGGFLVYATCSSEPEENEGVVKAFLDRQRGFRGCDLRDESHPVLRPFLDEHGFFRTSPADHGLEAFFAAVLRRA